MNSTIDIRIEGQHGSISDLEWLEVPPFAVITGVDGTGKSQLLEVIAASYNALRARGPDGSNLRVQAHAEIKGAEFVSGEVFHSYGAWPAHIENRVSEVEIKDALRNMHANVRSASQNLTAGGAPPPIWLQDFMDAFVARLGITMAEAKDLSFQQFYENITPDQLWNFTWPMGNGGLGFLVLAYYLFERDARLRGLTDDEIRGFYGESPWAILDEILATSGLPFRLVHPVAVRPSSLAYDHYYDLHLHDIERDVEVPVHRLSSGERVIMSTSLWRYSAQQGARHPRFLLLDEPDAHLHPSLTRRFLEVVRKVFVEERGVRVIMTTHSPSTVSLAPEESLFEMRRTPPRIQRATSKPHAVAVLTDGFVAVQEATQTVLLEGKDDPPFYEQVWDLLTERTGISEPGPLEPFPGVAFIYGKGKDTVEELIPQMRSHGFQSFHGIIDRDLSNTSLDGVHVISRNGMENYLYDPLNVWILLYSKGHAPDVPGVAIPRGRAAFIRRLPMDQLQQIIDVIFAQVVSEVPNLRSEENRIEEVTFLNGTTLAYPRWFLYRDDKSIAQYNREAFSPYLNVSQFDLLQSYAALNMVPQDLFNLLRAIQGSGRP